MKLTIALNADAIKTTMFAKSVTAHRRVGMSQLESDKNEEEQFDEEMKDIMDLEERSTKESDDISVKLETDNIAIDITTNYVLEMIALQPDEKEGKQLEEEKNNVEDATDTKMDGDAIKPAPKECLDISVKDQDQRTVWEDLKDAVFERRQTIENNMNEVIEEDADEAVVGKKGSQTEEMEDISTANNNNITWKN